MSKGSPYTRHVVIYQPTTLPLTEPHREYLRIRGDGSMTQGVRRVLDACLDTDNCVVLTGDEASEWMSRKRADAGPEPVALNARRR